MITTHPHIEAFEKRLWDVMQHFFERERGRVTLKVTMGPRFFHKLKCFFNPSWHGDASRITTDFGNANVTVIKNYTWEGFLITLDETL